MRMQGSGTILNVWLVMHILKAIKAMRSHGPFSNQTQVLDTYINLVTRNCKLNALTLIEIRRKMKHQGYFAIMLP